MAEWEKVLYKAQAFPDTYTPPSFLDDVVLNAHVKERHYWKVVKSSGTLLQQISTVCISVCVSIHLYRESIGFGLMSSICIAVLIVGMTRRHIIVQQLRRLCVVRFDRKAYIGRVNLPGGKARHFAYPR